MSGISRGLPDRGAVGAPQEGQNLEESASPFFAFSCGLAGYRWLIIRHGRNAGMLAGPESRERLPGPAFLLCPPLILEGAVFSGVN